MVQSLRKNPVIHLRSPVMTRLRQQTVPVQGSLEAAGTRQSQNHGVTELGAAMAAPWLVEETDKVRSAA